MKKLILRVTAILFIGGLTGVFSQESGGGSGGGAGGSGCDCGGPPPPPPGGYGRQPSSGRPGRPSTAPDASACGRGTKWDPNVMKCVGAAPQSTTIAP